MRTTHPTIGTDTARDVLWHYGRLGGTQPGKFTESLIGAIQHADQHNRAVLGADYPDLVAAVDLARRGEDGLAQLQRIARGQARNGCTCGVGPYTLDGRCETCTPFPPRGGHQERCAYASGIGRNCSCGDAA
ncbi:hypothetical protein [Streptomyces venezuelae]